MIDVVEILQHWHAGRPKVVVASSLGVDVKTVRKYVAPAEAAGIVPGDGAGLGRRPGWLTGFRSCPMPGPGAGRNGFDRPYLHLANLPSLG